MPQSPNIPRAAMLAAVLARALPDAKPFDIARAVGAMVLAARAHAQHAANRDSLNPVREQRGDKRCARLARVAEDALCECVGIRPSVRSFPHVGRFLRLSFGGDPRGPCGRLHISDRPGDGLADGWAIFS